MKKCQVNISKIIVALVISVIFMSTPAIGDIAPPNAQGETMQPINVTNVQMVNEAVHIDLYVENAAVKCNFTLMNHGANENMLVGFPVGLGFEGHGDDPYTYPLEDFKAYVNSQPVETREMDVNGSMWMVWDMSFDAMEIKDVDVSYWVPLSYYGNYGRMASHWFTYVLKTGAAWGGVIEEANIAMVLHDIESDQITELTPDGYVFENNIITWNFTSLEPTENIYIQFETLHEERYTIPGFVSDENHAGIPDATVELHYRHGEIIDDVYGKPLVTRTFNGTGGAVGWYNLTNLSDDGGDWIDVVIVARVLDAAGNERMGISAPVTFCPFHGWYGGAVNVTIDLSSPPASITHPRPTAGTTHINWTWTNPPDPDFNHTEIYLNGAFQTITSAEHFNATDLAPETSYIISARIVDTSGNINPTWVNDTATTLTLPAPPSAASSTATGATKDAYRTNEDVYTAGSGFTTANADIYVVQDQDWNDGDPIPADVTGSVETVSVSDGDIAPVLVWHAPLASGRYDIVIDANQNGDYDAATDGLDRGSPGFVVIISPPPTLPTDVPALTPQVILALIGLFCVIGTITIRRRFN